MMFEEKSNRMGCCQLENDMVKAKDSAKIRLDDCTECGRCGSHREEAKHDLKVGCNDVVSCSFVRGRR